MCISVSVGLHLEMRVGFSNILDDVAISEAECIQVGVDLHGDGVMEAAGDML